MCRLLAYCSGSEASLEDLIGADGLRDFTGLCALHGDGWGMAWCEGDEQIIRKSPIRADGEPEYDKLAREPLSDLGLVHLRWATPGLGVNEQNSHPFRYGEYVFAHNGAIHPQDRLPQMLPPQWEARLAGTTDSERYFLLIMSRLAHHGGNAGDSDTGDRDMVAAIAEAVADIDARFEPNSLNAILLSPDKLYAISWHHRDRVPEAKLRANGYDQPDIAAYFDLAYRAADSAVVVASSNWPQPGWTPLENGHVLVTERRTLKTRVLPLS
ncbi:MAG TPA: class II glutamine amidotransferase [Streptosporangiaceae bacterium]|nr:class II glutamine amidotransferase [Streptosporangiaceae bacterium]